jgi:hypothetical protein
VTLINEKGPLKRGSSCCSWQPDACFADEEDKIDVDEWQQKSSRAKSRGYSAAAGLMAWLS